MQTNADDVGEGDEILDSRLLLPQDTTARLLGISPQAFLGLGVQPYAELGGDALYHWPHALAVYVRRRAELARLRRLRAKLLELPTRVAPLANPQNPDIAREVFEREVLAILAAAGALNNGEAEA